MSVTIESDLKEVLAKIEQKIDKLSEDVNRKIDKLSDDVNRKIDKLSDDVNQKIDKLDTKIDKLDERLTKLEIGQAEIKTEIKGVEKRLESQEFISRGVLIGLIVAILGGLAKLFGFVGNP